MLRNVAVCRYVLHGLMCGHVSVGDVVNAHTEFNVYMHLVIYSNP